MIEQTEVYGHKGYLVKNAEGQFGVFVYHDVGAMKGYQPWNKLRSTAVIFNKRKGEWQFRMVVLKGAMKVFHKAHESIGIRPEFLDEWVEVINRVYAEIKGKPELAAMGFNELKRVGIENMAKREERIAETEEERLLKELSPRRKP